jgi:hypothetical protein
LKFAALIAFRAFTIFICTLYAGGFHPTIPFTTDTSPPVVEIWYGEHQVFGRLGTPQRWINILGKTIDPESGIAWLTYRLNGYPPIALRLGPDRRRLAHPGDFNVEIDWLLLAEGHNRLVFEAMNTAGLSSQTMVTVEVHHRTWPLPYTIRWSEVENILDVVQVVDGKWTWDANGARPAEHGYDRVLAVGDLSWTDYEVTVPATIHGVDLSGYETSESGGAGLGVNFHWLGHTDDPHKCRWDRQPIQPHCGWRPNGGSNWYSFRRFRPENPQPDYLAIDVDPSPQPEEFSRTQAIEFQFGHTYHFKARVERNPEGLLWYRLKVWEPAVEDEPVDWTLERLAYPGDEVNGVLQNGSILLVSHHVDVTFGDITITSLATQR